MNMWKPEESDRKYTKKELALNWLQYHIWYIVAIVAAAALLGGWIYSAVSYQAPDYQVAYVGKDVLPSETDEAISAILSALGEDLNGDGKVDVVIKSYASGSDPQMQVASTVGLTADLQMGESFFFLMDDPAAFQAQYQVLSGPDGAIPEEGDVSLAGKVYAWKNCPALADGQLDEVSAFILDGLYLGRRCRYEEEEYDLSGWERLWARIIEGGTAVTD